MKILITNAVPLNGGDEALLRATIESLQVKCRGAKIKVLCTQMDLCRKYLPDIDFDSSLEFMRHDEYSLSCRIRRLLRNRLKIALTSRISLMLASRDERRVIGHYKKADIIISSPGGFLHDYYPVEERLNGIEMAVAMGKKVVIFAQSVGPFWKTQSIKQVKKVFPGLHRISLRDNVSYGYLADIGLPMDNVYVTADAAFLWRHLAPELFVAKTGELKLFAMCFREWSYAGWEMKTLLHNAVKLCMHILDKANHRIHFLSTCQGVDGYGDDSGMASNIVQQLPEELRKRCTVDRGRYSPRDLIREYAKCDAFIGMRLHGAILSMLGGTPAMGLGYEEKTRGVFAPLGLERYQVSANADYEKWIECFDGFMKDARMIGRQLPLILDEAARAAEKNLDAVWQA